MFNEVLEIEKVGVIEERENLIFFPQGFNTKSRKGCERRLEKMYLCLMGVYETIYSVCKNKNIERYALGI